MKPESRKSLARNVCVIGAITLAILLLTELGTGYYFHATNSIHRFSTLQAINKIQDEINLSRAQDSLDSFKDQWGILPGELWVPFFSGENEILELMKSKYEEHFSEFVATVREIDSKLVLLYIPSDWRGRSRTVARAFYKTLSEKYGADFVDVTDEFTAHDRSIVYLEPRDTHLSRFGSILVAEKLARHLGKYLGYRSGHAFDARPAAFADLPPNFNATWEVVSDAPYKVITNSYGFRMSYDFSLADKRQKILVLGDSFSFGPFLPNTDIYTTLLDAKMEDAIVMNAAMFAYTISDESALFRERAKYSNPDVTILQVLDNDLTGLLFYYLNRFNRAKQYYPPTEAELAFLRKVSGKE